MRDDSGRIRALLEPWCNSWGLPGLHEAITVEFSLRLKSSAGRCRPQTGRITLHNSLRHELRDLLPEVLCHEAAHVAAFQLWGRAQAPHGQAWASLVRAAGFEPTLAIRRIGRTRTRSDASRSSGRRVDVHSRRVVLHTCPVCQASRLAKRRMPGWRCAECVRAGLAGRMEAQDLVLSES